MSALSSINNNSFYFLEQSIASLVNERFNKIVAVALCALSLLALYYFMFLRIRSLNPKVYKGLPPSVYLQRECICGAHIKNLEADGSLVGKSFNLIEIIADQANHCLKCSPKNKEKFAVMIKGLSHEISCKDNISNKKVNDLVKMSETPAVYPLNSFYNYFNVKII